MQLERSWIYVRVCVCVFVRMYVSRYVCVCVHMYVRVCVCMVRVLLREISITENNDSVFL